MSLKTILPPPQTAAQLGAELIRRLHADAAGNAAGECLAKGRIDELVHLVGMVVREMVNADDRTQAASVGAGVVMELSRARRAVEQVRL